MPFSKRRDRLLPSPRKSLSPLWRRFRQFSAKPSRLIPARVNGRRIFLHERLQRRSTRRQLKSAPRFRLRQERAQSRLRRYRDARFWAGRMPGLLRVLRDVGLGHGKYLSGLTDSILGLHDLSLVRCRPALLRLLQNVGLCNSRSQEKELSLGLDRQHDSRWLGSRKIQRFCGG